MENAFSVDLYIKLFQITTYVNDFQMVNNLGSEQSVGVSKISSTLHFDTILSLTSFIIITTIVVVVVVVAYSPSEALHRYVTPGDLRSPQHI